MIHSANVTHQHMHTHTHTNTITHAHTHTSNTHAYSNATFLQKKCERYWLQESGVPYEMGRELSVTMEKFKLYAECEVREFIVEKVGRDLTEGFTLG